jgi:hypothetical protein
LNTSGQFGALILDIGHNLLGEPKFLEDLFYFHGHGNTIYIASFK